MEKAKLGISIGLLGAAVYFLGLINSTGLIIVAGYILLIETSPWLKKCAVKALAILFIFALIPIALSFVTDIFSFINSVINGFGGNARLDWPLNIDSWVNIAANFIEKLLLVFLGITALSQGSVAVGPIDKFVDRHM